MARLFDDASSQGLYVNTAAATAPPFTISCWFRTDIDNAIIGLVGLFKKENAFSPRWVLSASGETAGDPLRWFSDPSSNANAYTTTGFTINTWHHACAIEASSTSRSVYLDGGGKGTNTSNPGDPSDNVNRTTIGYWGDSTPGTYMSGSIAEVGIWNAALTDAEVAILAKGFSPLFVRPQNLRFYAPLVRDEDRDLRGGLLLTSLNAPTVSGHPRVIHPPRRMGYVTISPPEPEIVDSYSETNRDADGIGGLAANLLQANGQSFTGTATVLDHAKWFIRKVDSPIGNVVTKIYAHSGTFGVSSVPTGSALAVSEPVDVSTLPIGFSALTTFNFTADNRIILEAGVKYVATIEYYGVSTWPDHVQVGSDMSSPTHPGNTVFTQDNFATWEYTTAHDTCFYVYGLSTAYSRVNNETSSITDTLAKLSSRILSDITGYVDTLRRAMNRRRWFAKITKNWYENE